MTTDAKQTDIAFIQCRNCRASWETTLNFCGRCGQRLRGATTTILVEPMTPVPGHIASIQGTGQKFRWLLYAVLACCLTALLIENALLLINRVPLANHVSSTKTVVTTPSKPGGTLWFHDTYAQGDSVALGIHNLRLLKDGRVYMAWLINAYRPNDLLPIGSLTPDEHSTVTFDSSQLPAFNPNRQNLRLRFTQVLVTIERPTATIQRPVGPIVLRGAIPPQAVSNLTQLFVTTTYTPAQIALLPGLRSQMYELARWMANLSHAQQRNNMDSIHTDLLRFIYIIEGSNGSDSTSLHLGTMTAITSDSDGLGILSSRTNCQVNLHTCGYLDALRTVLQALSSQKAINATAMQHLLTTLNNVEQLVQTMRNQIIKFIPLTTLTPAAITSLTLLRKLSDELLNGVDHDGDGSIDPIPGEAGTAQLYTYLQQVGSIPLVGV